MRACVCVEQRRNAREIPDRIRRLAASSATIPTCENPGVTLQGIEPGSPRWEASRLTAQPTRLQADTSAVPQHRMSWNKCFLCQVDSKEKVIEPSRNKDISRVTDSYKSLSAILVESKEINDLPASFDVFLFNEESSNPFSAIVVDQAHEQHNESVKGDGDAVGILQDPVALRKWAMACTKIQ
ncbi:hypothetical protein PR048_009968 [Dryococelus australis]|uniref:Uncharacterized protein n=1 Tax=Dryococelus australis TaxID=614101 RepID=A0ABQ9I1D9_9NEOP|nr:hypothetical protein PR048_009968 [Dryococelus australis]